jgi:hypothetical protein
MYGKAAAGDLLRHGLKPLFKSHRAGCSEKDENDDCA